MADVNLTLDRERALRELVRIANFIKRRPEAERTVNDKEALREIEADDGLEQLLIDAPLFTCPESPPVEEPPVEEPPPPPPSETPAGYKLLMRDAFPNVGKAPNPFVMGSDNQAGAIVGEGSKARIHLTGERAEFSCYKQPNNSSATWAPGDQYWFLGGFEYLSDLKLGGPGHHTTILQLLKGVGTSGGGSPTQSLELGDYGAGPGLYLSDRGTYKKIATTKPGQHYALGARVLGATGSGGSYTITLDGATIANLAGIQTAQGATSVAKFGLYGGAGTIIWDNCRYYVPV